MIPPDLAPILEGCYESCVKGYTEDGRSLDELHEDLTGLAALLLQRASVNPDITPLDVAMHYAQAMDRDGLTAAAMSLYAAAHWLRIQEGSAAACPPLAGTAASSPPAGAPHFCAASSPDSARALPAFGGPRGQSSPPPPGSVPFVHPSCPSC